MSSDIAHLLKRQRFLPLFVTQFLGAMNDNLFKSALVVLVTYELAAKANVDGPVMVTAAAGIFILPFFLFSATAGQLADRYDKAQIARMVKVGEVLIMVGGAIAFFSQNIWALMVILFLMGSQSSLFGPVKYAILPQHLHKDELIGGNAMVEAGTFLAILIGTIAGGLLILADDGVLVVSVLIIGLAVLGYGASVFIPAAPALAKDLHVDLNIYRATHKMVRHAASRRDVILSILGISWFWLVGATFLSQFPTFSKDVLAADETVVTLFLSTFSIGIAIGSVLCNKLLKGEITAKYVPLGAILMSVFMLDLYFASTSGYSLPTNGTDWAGVGSFLSTFMGWRISVDLLLVAVSSGLYIVPLYAILQTRGEDSHRSRNIASNNIFNALFMVVSALIISAMLGAGLTVPHVFLSVAIANAFVGIYICKLLPADVIKVIKEKYSSWLGGSQLGKLFLLTLVMVVITAAMFIFSGPIPQPVEYHNFADTRGWLGIPNFGDVVSNLLFMIIGFYGLWVLSSCVATESWLRDARLPLTVFFIGTVFVGPASAYYHWAPDHASLFWDRIPITVVFMALTAAVISDRIAPKWGAQVGLPILVCLGASLALHWRLTDDLRAYVLVQILPVIAVPIILWMWPKSDPHHRTWITWPMILWAMVLYGLAKVTEFADVEIFEMLGGVISGHSIKHLLAAGVVLVVALKLDNRRA